MSLKFGFTAEQIVQEGRTQWADIFEIKDWIKTTNLPQIQDQQIVQFLLSCNNVVADTKDTILAYYKWRHLSPELFNNRDTESNDHKHIITVVEAAVITKRTKDNNLIICGRLKNTSYWNFNIDNAIRYLFMYFDAAINEYPPNGLIVVFDMKGVGLMHLTKLRLSTLKKFFHFVQEGLPCQLIAIHLMNSVYFIDKLMSILKPFMKKELYDMIHFHQSNVDMNMFYQDWVQRDCLPADYGGGQPCYKELDEINLRRMVDNQDYYDREEALRTSYVPSK